MVLLIVALSAGSLAASADQDAILRASALARAGNVKQAETVLRSAATNEPDSAPLHGALGKLLFTEKDYSNAVQELNLAEQLDPDSRQYSMLLAASLLGAKRYGVARNFLLTVQMRFQQYSEFHYSLGLAYYNLADIAKSRRELEEAIRLNPKMDEAQFVLSTCLASEGDFSKAAEILRGLVKNHPRNAIYWTTLGDTLRQMGNENRAEALRACRTALALEPGNPQAQFVMAVILLDAGDFPRARTILEHLEHLVPKEIKPHVELGRVYARLGRPDLAREEAKIANKLMEDQVSESSPPTSK